MVPVFDISLLGTLTAIWAAAKVIFSTIGKGLDWIAKKALSALIASKFWATAFFLGLGVAIVSVFYGLISAVAGSILPSLSGSLEFDNDTFVIMSYLVHLDKLASFLNFLVSLVLAYLSITKISFVFRGMLFLFKTITGAWKT